jgi:hypothetical protein
LDVIWGKVITISIEGGRKSIDHVKNIMELWNQKVINWSALDIGLGKHLDLELAVLHINN